LDIFTFSKPDVGFGNMVISYLSITACVTTESIVRNLINL
jgi:hypothetical protein